MDDTFIVHTLIIQPGSHVPHIFFCSYSHIMRSFHQFAEVTVV